jgi:penicillin G amidase
VARARLLHRFGRKTAGLLRPPDPLVDWDAHPELVLEAVDDGLAAALAGIGAAPKFSLESRPAVAGGDGDGSNNWVVSGARSRSGKPVLANDPHRALDHPSLRYLVHLEAPGLRAIGAVVPWFPGIAIGHNERIGWGLTIFAIDAQDLVQERLDPANPERYRVGAGFEQVRTVRETIHVRGGSSVAVELKFTRHGPVVHEDRARHLAWALRWTGSEPGTAGYLAGLSLARAKSWPDFREALKRWKMPGENFVYADVDGHIGYQATGLAPIRGKGSGLLPVPESSGEHVWTGFASLDELPHAFDPPEGFLATANHNTLRPGNRVVGHEWSSSFRSRRIFEVLRAARPFGVEESKELQQDVVSLPAREIVPLLRDVTFGDGAPEEQRLLAAARTLLLAWDQRMERNSPGAAIFAAFHARLAADYVASVLPPGTAVESEIIRGAAGEVLGTGLGKADDARRDMLVAGTFRAAVLELAKRLGDAPTRWSWGALHHAQFTHRLAVDEGSRALFNQGPLARPGYAFTVNQTGGADYTQTSGATFRQILDLADWDASVVTSAPGQSGQPGSPHFSDLLPLWAEGEYIPLAFSREKVEGVAAQRLMLVPVHRP